MRALELREVPQRAVGEHHRPGQLGDQLLHRLAHPPRRVPPERHAERRVVALQRAQQPDHALLHQLHAGDRRASRGTRARPRRSTAGTPRPAPRARDDLRPWAACTSRRSVATGSRGRSPSSSQMPAELRRAVEPLASAARSRAAGQRPRVKRLALERFALGVGDLIGVWRTSRSRPQYLASPPCPGSASRAASCRLTLSVLTIAPAPSLAQSVGTTGARQHDRAARRGAEATAHPRDAPTATDGHSGAFTSFLHLARGPRRR